MRTFEYEPRASTPVTDRTGSVEAPRGVLLGRERTDRLSGLLGRERTDRLSPARLRTEPRIDRPPGHVGCPGRTHRDPGPPGPRPCSRRPRGRQAGRREVGHAGCPRGGAGGRHRRRPGRPRSDGLDDKRSSSRTRTSIRLHAGRPWIVSDSPRTGMPSIPVESIRTASTVLDCSGLAAAPMNAVARAVAAGCYRSRPRERLSPLPWLLVDEVHALSDGVAAPALRPLLTRGRAPGVSIAAATQRPAVVPDVAVSQTDLLVAHRLTAATDVEAPARARPASAGAPLHERLPDRPAETGVLDDATAAVHVVRLRSREGEHGGDGTRTTRSVWGWPHPAVSPAPGTSDVVGSPIGAAGRQGGTSPLGQ